jgi:restriction system protein
MSDSSLDAVVRSVMRAIAELTGMQTPRRRQRTGDDFLDIVGDLMAEWERGAAAEIAASVAPRASTSGRRVTPQDFERWVGTLFERQGYQVRQTGTHGTGGDHGVDLVVARPGERAVVQCKHYGEWKVGEPTLHALYGVMHAAGVDKAYLVTSGRVTGPAWRWARGKPIEIWDGAFLARLQAGPVTPPGRAVMREVQRTGSAPASEAADRHGQSAEAVRHTASALYAAPLRNALTQSNSAAGPPARPVTDTPSTVCPRCGGQLVVRRNRTTGDPFWGCTGFPRCRFTKPVEASTGPANTPGFGAIRSGEQILPSNRHTFRPPTDRV